MEVTQDLYRSLQSSTQRKDSRRSSSICVYRLRFRNGPITSCFNLCSFRFKRLLFSKTPAGAGLTPLTARWPAWPGESPQLCPSPSLLLTAALPALRTLGHKDCHGSRKGLSPLFQGSGEDWDLPQHAQWSLLKSYWHLWLQGDQLGLVSPDSCVLLPPYYSSHCCSYLVQLVAPVQWRFWTQILQWVMKGHSLVRSPPVWVWTAAQCQCGHR